MEVPKNLVIGVTISDAALRLLDTDNDQEVTSQELTQGFNDDKVMFSRIGIIPKQFQLIEGGLDEMTFAEFTRAIHVGDNAKLQRLLKETSFPIDQRDGVGRTLLMHACASGRAETVRTLLAAKANPTLEDYQGPPCLAYAIRANNVDAIRPLLAAGANMATSIDMASPMTFAAAHAAPAVIRTLAAAGAGVDEPDRAGDYPLGAAAAKGNTGAIDTLLAMGADIRRQNAFSWTALHSAAAGAHVTAIQQLVAAKADVSATDDQGNRPLHLAAYRPNSEAVTTLIQAGSDLNARNRLNGYTAVHVAAVGWRTANLVALLKAGADPNIPDNKGWPPIRVALDHNDAAMVEAFLDAKTNVNVTLPNGQTLLQYAKQQTRPDIVQLLKQAGAVNKP